MDESRKIGVLQNMPGKTKRPGRTRRDVDFGKHIWILHNNFARFGTPIEDVSDNISVKVSPSVACLISYIGDEQLFICSGFIMECELVDDAFVATLFTSATLLRPKYDEDEKIVREKIASGMKIEVILVDGEVFEGRIVGFDFHYNVAAIQVVSSTPLPTVVARPIAIAAIAEEGKSVQFALQPCTSASLFPISPGEPVFALGRHFLDPFDTMVAPGEICSDKCALSLTCKELLKSSCKIKKNGIGGPMINRDGEVIGINFCRESYTPFLPINIASKCFEHLKKDGRVPRPWIGLNGVDLHAVGSIREKINMRFPYVARGVFIEQVEFYSPAREAGVCPGDVVIRCCENDVGSLFELSEIIWDKVGKRVELDVIRARPYGQREGKMIRLIPKTYPEMEKIIVGPIIDSPPFDRNKYDWPVPKQYNEYRGRFWNEGHYDMYPRW